MTAGRAEGAALAPHEWAAARDLGARVAGLRRAANMTQVQLADQAELGVRHLQRIEAGLRRTRLSTLGRLAAAVGGDVAELAAMAGPSLASESVHADRMRVRRANRVRARRGVDARRRSEVFHRWAGWQLAHEPAEGFRRAMLGTMLDHAGVVDVRTLLIEARRYWLDPDLPQPPRASRRP